jgi:hypothetical protein
MRHKSDPIELIRNTNPVPDAHQLPDETQASFEVLFEEILGMEHQSTPLDTHKRPKLGRIAALAAVFLVVSAGVAVAAGVFSPDPKDVALLEDEAEVGFESHELGWRPALRTESVWCMYDLSTGADTPVSEFPLGEPLTMEALLAECGTGNDVARNLEAEPTEYTLCRATFTDQTYRDRIAQDKRFNIIEGDLSADRPGFPVVLAWETNCQTTTLETSFQVDLAPLTSLDDLNHAREVEVGLKADALESCLTRDEADEAARAARAELGDSWLVIDMNLDGAVDCYAVDLEPQWGTVAVIGQDDGTSADENVTTQSTAPPADS